MAALDEEARRQLGLTTGFPVHAVRPGFSSNPLPIPVPTYMERGAPQTGAPIPGYPPAASIPTFHGGVGGSVPNTPMAFEAPSAMIGGQVGPPAPKPGAAQPGAATPPPLPPPQVDPTRGPLQRAYDWTQSDTGQNRLGSIAGGLYGIEQPATTFAGSFARGFGQSIATAQGRKRDEAAAEAAAAAASAEAAEDRRRWEAEHALDVRGTVLDEQAALADILSDEDRVRLSGLGLTEGQIVDLNQMVSRKRQDLLNRYGANDFIGLTAEEAIEYGAAMDAYELREINQFREINDLPPIDSLDPNATPSDGMVPITGNDEPWGGEPIPAPGDPPRGSGNSPQDPIITYIPPTVNEDNFDEWAAAQGWVKGVTIFYNEQGVLSIWADKPGD